MTPEERQSIIDEAVEKALLVLPDVWSNLITDHRAMSKVTSKFYKDHPEFVGHEESVVSVLAEVDGKYPLLDYAQKIGKSVPGIKKRIDQLKGLDMKVDSNPDRKFDPIPSAGMGSNGEI